MIHAEVSAYPIGTDTTSGSFYLAKAIEAIRDIDEIRYQITPMGTILESKSAEKIFEAANKIMTTIHNLGVMRVEILLKIDSRKDKETKLEDKLESINKYLNQ